MQSWRNSIDLINIGVMIVQTANNSDNTDI